MSKDMWTIRRKRGPNIDVWQAVKLHDSGLSWPKVADEMGVAGQSLCNALQRKGIVTDEDFVVGGKPVVAPVERTAPPMVVAPVPAVIEAEKKRREWTTPKAFDHAEAVRLYAEGVGIDDLCERFGVKRGSIYRVVRLAKETDEDRAAKLARDTPAPLPAINLDPFAVQMPIGKFHTSKEVLVLLEKLIEQFGSATRLSKATGVAEADISKMTTGVGTSLKMIASLGLEWRPFKAAYEQVRDPVVYLRDNIVLTLEREIEALRGQPGRGVSTTTVDPTLVGRVTTLTAALSQAQSENAALVRRPASAQAMIPSFGVRVRLKAVA